MRENLRLLVIAPHYTSFIKDLVDATARHVSNVTVLAKYNPLSELARYIPFSYFRHVEKYSKNRLVDLSRKPENVGVHTVSIPYFIPDGRNKKLGDKLFVRFKKYINASGIEFDLIHAQFTWPSGYAAARLKREFNIPLVITAHGYDVYDLPFRDREWFERVKYALDMADHVITVSNSNKLILQEKLKVLADKLSVIPNGFDSKLFHPMNQTAAREKLNLPLNKKILLNVANLVPIKGHSYLLRAMREVVKHREDVMLVIVGDGPLRKDLDRNVKMLGLEDYVRFAGSRPHSEIPLWMNAADLFVLPSLSEGNPTVMFEALGVGLPFVGTAVGGVPEIITSEDYGLLCPPKDFGCLIEKILIGLEKEWNRERIRKYAEQFSWERIARQVMEVYKRSMT